nr:hypothetical protein [uncultured Capnocytophaga sp.]
MTAIDNIINQIEGETQNRGNTKTRIAAVLRLLRNKIANLFSDKLDKGTYTGNAGDLIVAIGNKVDKVPGKMLSTNDFTNELRAKLEGLRNVDISGLLPKGGYTGTAQNLKELIDNIMRIMQSPDTELDELREIVAYIKQNKRVLDTLGISNIAGLQDALRGKAPTDHHHDDRYSRLGHTHSEYALRTHRHNWDNIDGKPALATEGKIAEAVNGIKIGGRNYALNSKDKRTLVGYVGEYWNLSEPIKVGVEYTFSCYANVENGKRLTVYFKDIEGQSRQYIIINLVNGYNKATVIPSYEWTALCTYHEVYGISPVPTANIEKIKFEKGNTATDWTPAPEDLLYANNTKASGSIVLTHAHNDATIFLEGNSTVELSRLEDLDCVSFRKVFAGGSVTFTCAGKTIVYTGDTDFNGGDGSTAVVSVYGNKCYIDIRNV